MGNATSYHPVPINEDVLPQPQVNISVADEHEAGEKCCTSFYKRFGWFHYIAGAMAVRETVWNRTIEEVIRSLSLEYLFAPTTSLPVGFRQTTPRSPSNQIQKAAPFVTSVFVFLEKEKQGKEDERWKRNSAADLYSENGSSLSKGYVISQNSKSNNYKSKLKQKLNSKPKSSAHKGNKE
ncbi:unnamed protein product [Linum trigynum]|uniref:Uncharacterized protein n=1 Tax=Linum trigynum TaxID=586398 RepID=A0AAV2D9Y3_9ROSI